MMDISSQENHKGLRQSDKNNKMIKRVSASDFDPWFGLTHMQTGRRLCIK